jgi:hypothetical protein
MRCAQRSAVSARRISSFQAVGDASPLSMTGLREVLLFFMGVTSP